MNIFHIFPLSNFNLFHNTLLLVSLGLICFNNVSCAGEGDESCKLAPSTSSAKATVQEDILLNLKNHGLIGQKFLFKTSSDVRYELSICGDASSSPNAAVVRAAPHLHTDVIGLRNSTSVDAHLGSWVILHFGAGDVDSSGGACKNISQSSSVMIMCDRTNDAGDFSLIYKDEHYCSYLFELRISAVCGKAAAMSGWSVFFIIMIVFLSAYFIVGSLYMRYQKGAKGVDQIPHRHFWFGIGNKLSNCCAAVCRCDQYCSDSDGLAHLDSPSPYSGMYSPIGEGLPSEGPRSNSVDRDTPLLKP